MLSKVFCLYLLVNACAAEDALARLLRGAGGGACVRAGARACPAAAWRRRWLLARASCLLLYPLDSIYIQSGVANCSNDFTSPGSVTPGERCSHRVVARYTHPLYPDVDLALLRLNWPYSDTELSDNRTISDSILNKLDIWMKDILFTESTSTIQPVGTRNHLKMYSTPMKMFLATVVIPSASFVVFFLFVIFFTGKSKGNKIPYRNLNSDKKETTYV